MIRGAAYTVNLYQQYYAMQIESLIEWPEAIREFIQFISLFLAIGAVGFHYAVNRRLAGTAGPAIGDRANHRAAIIGLVGALIAVAQFAFSLPGAAVQRQLEISQLLTQDPRTILRLVSVAIAAVGFVTVVAGRRIGWGIALTGLLLGRVQGALTGRPESLINSFHVLSGGLWLGTLFVLVVAGIAVVLRHEPSRDRRGAIIADMVNRFSPLALVSAGSLVLFGLITAWRHLDPLSSLWTTVYGYTLITKLVVVAIVFALGAWNWRRQRPKLGTEDTAISIRRSSIIELSVAVVVLVISAILVAI